MHSRLQSDIKKIQKLKNHFSKEQLAILLSDNLSVNFADSKFNFRPFNNHSKELADIEKSAIEVEEKRNSLPLGKYAEFLFGEALEANNCIEVLTRNLQVFSGKTTVGEIDFLLKKIEHEIYYHLEFAQKYYLKTMFKGRLHYLGPSTKDWLKNKLLKMTTQQLKITDDFKSQLPTKFSKLAFEKKIIIKGSIFIPFEEYAVESASLSLGWWTDYKKSTYLFNANAFFFQAIYFRKDWIYPFELKGKMLRIKDLIEEISTNKLIDNGVMVVRYTKNHRPIDRGFLMKPNWPNN